MIEHIPSLEIGTEVTLNVHILEDRYYKNSWFYMQRIIDNQFVGVVTSYEKGQVWVYFHGMGIRGDERYFNVIDKFE